jgi:hypothetical protein
MKGWGVSGEELTMGAGSADIRKIPEERRHEITGQQASLLPVMYDLVFRGIIGDDYDRMEREIWVELGRQVPHLAGTYHLPHADAPGIAGAISVARALLFGPEFRSELLDISPDIAVILTKRCPFLMRTQEVGGVAEHNFTRCLAFSVTAAERLNPKYTLRFVRAMCMGDRHCECKILSKDTASDE